MGKKVIFVLLTVCMVLFTACANSQEVSDHQSNNGGDIGSVDILNESGLGEDNQPLQPEESTLPEGAVEIGSLGYYLVDGNKITFHVSSTAMSKTYIERIATENGGACYDVILEGGFTEIGEGDFSDCPYISSVSIPAHVERIGRNAFGRCTQLVKVELQENNSLKMVGLYAFAETPWLVAKQQENPLVIEKGVLFDASGVTDTEVLVPDGVTLIADGAFYEKDNITKVQLPETVRYIGEYSFRGCGEMVVNLPDAIQEVGAYAFAYCKLLPDAMDGEKRVLTLPKALTIIGDYAFALGEAEEIVFPEGLLEIGACAFENTYELERAIIPSTVTRIGACAFDNCASLSEISIPEGLTDIGKGAFANTRWYYEKIKTSPTIVINGVLHSFSREDGNIIVPEGVTIIPDNMFDESLTGSYKKITSVSLPSTLKTIGNDAFRNCNELVAVHIPEGVISIGRDAFYDCDGLVEVTLPSSLKEMGESAFSGSGVSHLTIPEGVQEIGVNVFNGCESLTEVYIPSSVTTIGMSAFENCISLAKVTIAEGVQEIGVTAFYGCCSLAEVNIPDGVKSIGDDAFGCCELLTRLDLPDSMTFVPNLFSEGAGPVELYLPSNLEYVDNVVYMTQYLEMNIYCKAGSATEELLILNSIPYVAE